MTPAAYDAWYGTSRGRWIGDRELAPLAGLLEARPGSLPGGGFLGISGAPCRG